MTWLRCDVDQHKKSLVPTLWCDVCRKYEQRICGLKNFSRAWIEGSGNHKTSSIVDHATSDQHKAAMMRLRGDQAKGRNDPVSSYSPIARSLLTMDDAVKERMKKKFDISYVLAKESMPFTKFPAFHELEQRHGVDLGQAYQIRESARTFVHYIAESQRQQFYHSLSSCHFYSFLMDGSTDRGKVENELVVIPYCQKDDIAEEVTACARYFTVLEPQKADTDDDLHVVECLGKALQSMGIEDLLDRAKVLGVKGHPVLVGGGTDGASVNVSEQNGMRGKLQGVMPWLFWAWCYAHRLELACRDAMSSKLFQDLVEMLLRLYYLYEKSPKKCRELTDIVVDLKEIFEFPKSGDLPVRAQGSRWISHKRKALQRVVDRYGAYVNHLSALVEDKTMKSTDRQRLRGYLLKWREGRMLLGCALYVDVLKPPSLLSLALQGDSIDVVLGIKHILKSSHSLKKLSSQDPLQWPTAKLLCSRIKEEDGNKVYQGAVLQRFNDTTKGSCKQQALADLKRLDERMRDRLEWSDVELLRAILVVLDTQNWIRHQESEGIRRSETDSDEEDDGLAEIKSALETITAFFQVPLEAKGADLSSLLDEIQSTQGSTWVLKRKATREFGTGFTLLQMLQSGKISF